MIFNWNHPDIPQYNGLVSIVIWPTGVNAAPPVTGTAIEDKIAMGMRQGTQQADVFMGGFG